MTKGRLYFWLLLLLVLIILASRAGKAGAYASSSYFQALTVVIIAAVLFIVGMSYIYIGVCVPIFFSDLMFFPQKSTFIYDPFYSNYLKLSAKATAGGSSSSSSY